MRPADIGGGPALHIDVDDCDGAVTGWRELIGAVGTTRTSASRLHETLQLDSGWFAFGPRFPTALSEFGEEMELAAQLLDLAADRARAGDYFDGSFDSLPGSLGILLSLWGSLNDGDGAGLNDLDDPLPAGTDPNHRVHLGYIPLFPSGGPAPGDVQQGLLGDCSLLATIAGLASTDPDFIRRLITDNGDGTYTVRLNGRTITVDDEFLATSDGQRYANERGALWPLVLEKAIAQYHGGYDGVRGQSPILTMEALGFDPSQWQPLPRTAFGQTILSAQIASALQSGRPVATGSSGAFGMGGTHAWSVTDLSNVDGTPVVTVRNPWGGAGMERRDGTWVYGDGTPVRFEDPADADRIRLDPNHPGMVSMPVDVFSRNFNDIVVGNTK